MSTLITSSVASGDGEFPVVLSGQTVESSPGGRRVGSGTCCRRHLRARRTLVTNSEGGRVASPARSNTGGTVVLRSSGCLAQPLQPGAAPVKYLLLFLSRRAGTHEKGGED